MLRNRLAIKFLLLFSAILSSASADPIKVTMTGAIDFSNMSAFAVGQQASVSIIYESDSTYQSLMTQQAFYVNPMSSVTFTSGGYSGTDNTGAFGLINLYNNLPVWFQTEPFDGISFLAAGNAGHYTFSSGANTVEMPSVFSNGVTQTFDLLRLNLEANYSTVWSNWDLPETIDYAAFNTTRNMIFGFSGGSFQAGISSIQFENFAQEAHPPTSNPVPDAGSTGLMALAGLTFLAWARRARTSAAV